MLIFVTHEQRCPRCHGNRPQARDRSCNRSNRTRSSWSSLRSCSAGSRPPWCLPRCRSGRGSFAGCSRWWARWWTASCWSGCCWLYFDARRLRLVASPRTPRPTRGPSVTEPLWWPIFRLPLATCQFLWHSLLVGRVVA